MLLLLHMWQALGFVEALGAPCCHFDLDAAKHWMQSCNQRLEVADICSQKLLTCSCDSHFLTAAAAAAAADTGPGTTQEVLVASPNSISITTFSAAVPLSVEVTASSDSSMSNAAANWEQDSFEDDQVTPADDALLDAYGSIEPYDEDYDSSGPSASGVYSPDDKIVIDITDNLFDEGDAEYEQELFEDLGLIAVDRTVDRSSPNALPGSARDFAAEFVEELMDYPSEYPGGDEISRDSSSSSSLSNGGLLKRGGTTVHVEDLPIDDDDLSFDIDDDSTSSSSSYDEEEEIDFDYDAANAKYSASQMIASKMQERLLQLAAEAADRSGSSSSSSSGRDKPLISIPVEFDMERQDQVLQLAAFLDKVMVDMPQEQQAQLRNMDMVDELTVMTDADNISMVQLTHSTAGIRSVLGADACMRLCVLLDLQLADLITQQVFLASGTASADATPEYGFLPAALPNSNLNPHLEGEQAMKQSETAMGLAAAPDSSSSSSSSSAAMSDAFRDPEVVQQLNDALLELELQDQQNQQQQQNAAGPAADGVPVPASDAHTAAAAGAASTSSDDGLMLPEVASKWAASGRKGKAGKSWIATGGVAAMHRRRAARRH